MNNKFIFKFPNKVNLKNYRHSSSNNAVFYGLNKKVEFCTKCTYSNQKPNSEKEFTHTLKTIKPTVKLKKKNVCNACDVHDYKKNTIDWKKREELLLKLCDKFRRKDGQYDCLVPGSGGIDSFFTAHKLKYKYGMNPLTITYSPHLYTDWGYKNFKSWIDSGFDNFLFTPNTRVHRLLTRISLENLFHPFQPFFFGQNYLTPKVAKKKFGIDLVFYGESPLEYGNDDDRNNPLKDPSYFTVKNPMETYIGGIKIKKLISEFGLSKNDLEHYLPISNKEFRKNKSEIHYLGWYLKWHPQEVYYYAVENSNFKPSPERNIGTYGKYKSIDDKMDDLHFYTTFIKFGIGRATYDSAQEIRNGELLRNEGIKLVKKFDGEYPKRFEKELFEYLSLPKNDFLKASKNFEKPIFNKEYFELLTDNFRSPHLWFFEKSNWKLRKKIN